MPNKPVIFISAVSDELKSARQLVANTLTFLGYEPEWQDIFGAEQGDLRGMLRRRIDASDGVVQLVGKCYGFEPHAADGVSPLPDAQFGRVSYTQYEALYAKQRGKPVWYFFLDGHFATDPHDPEPDELRKLQETYRERVRSTADLHHSASTPESLQLRVHELRNELAQLRRSAKRQAALVLLLLLLLAVGTAWVLHRQEQSQRITVATREEVAKLRESVNAFAGVRTKVQQAEPGQKPEEVEEKTYAELAKQFGLDAKLLRKKLPGFAEELRHAPDATSLERANAAFIRKDYPEAERLALAAAAEALKATPPRNADAIAAYELAGWSAQERIQYADALRHFRDAENLTNRARDPLEWARQQWNIAFILDAQGQYSAAEKACRAALDEYQRAHGSEDRVVLRVRHNLASALSAQGKYPEAEHENRAVLALMQRVLGPEHPDTLSSRNNLAEVLRLQGKHAEAEQEHRAVLAIRERVLGPVHVNTLSSRNNLANVLRDQGNYAEAETEHRALLAIRERVLGPEHLDTLASRNNLAAVLLGQSKHAEAEQELRAVLAISERVLGREHPDVFHSRANLASGLCGQLKYAEAEHEYRAVLALMQRVLGPEHPDTLTIRNNLAAALDAQGKYAEAETEYRAWIPIGEHVLGRGHPEVLRGYFNWALVLGRKKEYREALDFARRAEEGWVKVLGPEHPDSKDAKGLREQIEGKIEKEEAK